MNKSLNLEDLMVNDIVLAEATWYDDDDNERTEWHPFRITDISPNGSLICDGSFDFRFIGEWLDDCDAESIGDLIGMPLTEEILRANVFEFKQANMLTQGYDGYWTHTVGRFVSTEHTEHMMTAFDFSIIEDNGEFWIFNDSVQVRFAHELQHALKLGTNNLKFLANNFKVK